MRWNTDAAVLAVQRSANSFSCLDITGSAGTQVDEREQTWESLSEACNLSSTFKGVAALVESKCPKGSQKGRPVPLKV